MNPAYYKEQSLNQYVKMLNDIYGPSQNYNKSKFEILSHLAEVCGALGRFIPENKFDGAQAVRFIPKIFGWACALVISIDRHGTDLERMIFQKFPGVCPYCLADQCACWNGPKPNINEDQLKAHFLEKQASPHGRSIVDFEAMFRKIYSHTWHVETTPDASYCYLRLIEELAELSEAVRLSHLYPKNFENEIADFLARWFALCVTLRAANKAINFSTDDLLWRAYPAECLDCQSAPCFCQQGPVRELLSKPAFASDIDSKTSTRRAEVYRADLRAIEQGRLLLTLPIACVRIDLDKFGQINKNYSQSAGDAALAFFASKLRSKANLKTRIYRDGGDEFALILPDTTLEEGVGLMKRVMAELKKTTMPWTSLSGEVSNILISMSVGVDQCDDLKSIKTSFEKADLLSKRGKKAGGGRIVTKDHEPS